MSKSTSPYLDLMAEALLADGADLGCEVSAYQVLRDRGFGRWSVEKHLDAALDLARRQAALVREVA